MWQKEPIFKQCHSIFYQVSRELNDERNEKRTTVYDEMHRRYSKNTEILVPSATTIMSYFLQNKFWSRLGTWPLLKDKT